MQRLSGERQGRQGQGRAALSVAKFPFRFLAAPLRYCKWWSGPPELNANKNPILQARRKADGRIGA